jgi:hypothetical protein
MCNYVTVLLDFMHNLIVLTKTTTFRKLHLLPSSGDREKDKAYSVGPSDRAGLELGPRLGKVRSG